jgi:hypothetical protein
LEIFVGREPKARSVLAHGHHSLALGYFLSGFQPFDSCQFVQFVKSSAREDARPTSTFVCFVYFVVQLCVSAFFAVYFF